jgi:uncharacterized protein YaiI (UPF0178 family)
MNTSLDKRSSSPPRPPWSLRIWIDADAAPRDVKDVVFRAASRLSLSVTLVANKAMHTPSHSPNIQMVQVKGGADVADDYIVEHAVRGDVVITADIPLAARLVPLGTAVIDPRGDIIDADTVSERLSVRDFMSELRDTGTVTGGPKPYGPKDKARFANALDATLQRLLKR